MSGFCFFLGFPIFVKGVVRVFKGFLEIVRGLRIFLAAHCFVLPLKCFFFFL